MIAEKTIARRLVRSLLTQGFALSVWDGGDYPITDSRQERAIMAALASTDSDWLIARKDGVRGGVLLIWGNGEDLISDYSMSLEPYMQSVIESF